MRLGRIVGVERQHVGADALPLAAQLVLRSREEVVERLTAEVDLGDLLTPPHVGADRVPRGIPLVVGDLPAVAAQQAEQRRAKPAVVAFHDEVREPRRGGRRTHRILRDPGAVASNGNARPRLDRVSARPADASTASPTAWPVKRRRRSCSISSVTNAPRTPAGKRESTTRHSVCRRRSARKAGRSASHCACVTRSAHEAGRSGRTRRATTRRTIGGPNAAGRQTTPCRFRAPPPVPILAGPQRSLLPGLPGPASPNLPFPPSAKRRASLALALRGRTDRSKALHRIPAKTANFSSSPYPSARAARACHRWDRIPRPAPRPCADRGGL